MSVLEKAAKAAWALTCPGLAASEVDAVYAAQTDGERKMFEALARAVLEAVREPTKEMLHAAYDLDDQPYHGAWPQDSWPAMIDAILAPRP